MRESKGSGKTCVSSLSVPGTELGNLNNEGRFTPELQSSLMCEAVSITARHTLYCQGAVALSEIKGVITVILSFNGGAVMGLRLRPYSATACVVNDFLKPF